MLYINEDVDYVERGRPQEVIEHLLTLSYIYSKEYLFMYAQRLCM